MSFPIHGTVASGLDSVREVFQANFDDDIDVGAGFCVYYKGECLVDLWGGYQDQAQTRPWEENTLVNVYSTTKGIASVVVASVVQEGLLDYDAPVTDIWPEFRAAQNGLTIGQFLSHQSGVCGLRDTVTVADLYDWQSMCTRLANEEPFWEPGKGAGYHAILWGFFAGELVRRVTGKTLGELLAIRFTRPLECEFHIGLPVSEHNRVADLIGPNRARIQPEPIDFASIKVPELYGVALQNPVIRPYKDVCSPQWRSAEVAAANGHATAKGIATIYDAVINHTSVLEQSTIDQLVHEEWGDEEDLVLGKPMRRGRGINLNTDETYGPGVNSFGHSGAGGSTGFADPDACLSFGYVMNQMQPGLETDTRSKRLIDAVYRAVS